MFFRNILFDLDGTIIDSSEGIAGSMHYAFDRLGKAAPDRYTVVQSIGPPLCKMLEKLLETTDKELIDRAAGYFRERYSEKGLHEVALYDGIAALLYYLYTLGRNMMIVTSKPQVFAATILKRLGIEHYFKRIAGSALTLVGETKASMLNRLLAEEKLEAGETVYIGDRVEDVEAATDNNLFMIAVSYGYGNIEDLERANADLICHSPEELNAVLCT